MNLAEKRLSLPYAQWPSADRLLWETAINGDDPFGDAAGVRLSRETLYRYQSVWGRSLGFLAVDEPTALDIAPSERLAPDRIRRLIAHLAQTQAPRSVAQEVDALYQVARMMMPEQDWTWLRAVKTRLLQMAPRRTRRGPVITSIQLLDLGLELMEESKRATDTPFSRRQAFLYRDGLIIALLAFIPLRRKNLAGLKIGRHLVRQGDHWFVIISREETKTGTPIEFPIPELLTPYLATYLDVVRPRMNPLPNCDAPWVNSKRRALSATSITFIIGQHSASRMGIRVTPHDARDAAATTWAVAAPDQIGIARDLLAHRDLRTTIKHYNRARGIEASRAYGRAIAGIRRKRNHQQMRSKGPVSG
jgi:integrase